MRTLLEELFVWAELLNNSHSEPEKILDIIQDSCVSLPMRKSHHKINQCARLTDIPTLELGQNPQTLDHRSDMAIELKFVIHSIRK